MTYDDLLDECWILGGGSALARTAVERMGGYRSDSRTEDYDLFVRLLASGGTHRYLPACLYRYHYGAVAHKNEDLRLTYEAFAVVLERVLADGMLDEETAERTRRAIAYHRERTSREFLAATEVNAAVQQQAGAVYAAVARVLPAGLVAPTMRALHAVKGPLTPLRMRLARRRTARGGERR